MASPLGLDISSDGATLVIADAAAEPVPEARGVLFTLSTGGGTPTPLSGTEGYAPRGLAAISEPGGDQIYFTGVDPADGLAGVFKVPLAGGAVSALAKGGALLDPGGIAVSRAGEVYLVDVADSERKTARVLKVSGSGIELLRDELSVGYPAGIALSQDEGTLLVSAFDAQAESDAVVRLDLATREIESLNAGIDVFDEPAGLHRAKDVDAYAWADSGAHGSGAVFILNQPK